MNYTRATSPVYLNELVSQVDQLSFLERFVLNVYYSIDVNSKKEYQRDRRQGKIKSIKFDKKMSYVI